MIDTKMNQPSRLTSFLRNVAVFFLSSCIGLIFTIALVALADLRGWCCVNSEIFQEGGVIGSEETGTAGAICSLDIPVNKTATAFTKAVDRVVGEAIEAWEQVRPVQPAS